MSRKLFGLVFLLMVGLLSFGVVAAQDATPEVTANPQPTLGDITGNHTQYYGAEVTVTGNIEEFVNARAFVLGDGDILNDHKVLVIDNDSQELYLWIHKNLNVT